MLKVVNLKNVDSIVDGLRKKSPKDFMELINVIKNELREGNEEPFYLLLHQIYHSGFVSDVLSELYMEEEGLDDYDIRDEILGMVEEEDVVRYEALMDFVLSCGDVNDALFLLVLDLHTCSYCDVAGYGKSNYKDDEYAHLYSDYVAEVYVCDKCRMDNGGVIYVSEDITEYALMPESLMDYELEPVDYIKIIQGYGLKMNEGIDMIKNNSIKIMDRESYLLYMYDDFASLQSLIKSYYDKPVNTGQLTINDYLIKDDSRVIGLSGGRIAIFLDY